MKTNLLKVQVYLGHVEVQKKDGECVAILNFGESGGYPDEKSAVHAAKIIINGDKVLNHLKETVERYGKPGGPWNIPSEPGDWIFESKKILKLF